MMNLTKSDQQVHQTDGEIIVFVWSLCKIYNIIEINFVLI